MSGTGLAKEGPERGIAPEIVTRTEPAPTRCADDGKFGGPGSHLGDRRSALAGELAKALGAKGLIGGTRTGGAPEQCRMEPLEP